MAGYDGSDIETAWSLSGATDFKREYAHDCPATRKHGKDPLDGLQVQWELDSGEAISYP